MMAGTIASLLTDFSPAAGKEPFGINVLRAVKAAPVSDVEPEPQAGKADRQAELIRLAEINARAEERKAADERLEELLAEERARHEDDLSTQRRLWVEQEATPLSAQLVDGLMRLEAVLSDRVANILRPFLSEAHRQQTVADFKDALSTVLLEQDTKVIKVMGPADLLSVIEAHLETHSASAAVELLPGDYVEMSLTVHDTTVQTQLTTWASRLEQALKAET